MYSAAAVIQPFRSLRRGSMDRSASLHRVHPDPEDQAPEDIDLEAATLAGTAEVVMSQAATASRPNDPKKLVHHQKIIESATSRVTATQQGWFNAYKRLFLLSFAVNLSCLVAAILGRFSYARNRAALFTIGNVLAVVFCRNEAFLRCIFSLVVTLLGKELSKIPLWVKIWVTAFLQSLGGIHSGCGVSSLMWLAYALAQSIRSKTTPWLVIGVAIGVLVLLLASCMAAFPALRHLHHNVFERVHRFAGWASLALLWTFILLLGSYHSQTGSYSIHGGFLITQQEFWITAVITFLIILPWLTVRRVPVQTIVPSHAVTIMKFTSAGVKAGILARISRSPFSEWHAFGIISDGVKDHMVLAGAVGDFTKDLVRNPPTHLWVRCVHFAGLPYLANMYNRVLFVATGSGIGVFLSFLLQPNKTEVYLIWIAKSIETTFGSEVYEMVQKYPEDKRVVYDTAIRGRPNLDEMAVGSAQKWAAEVVIVTSNPSGTRDVVSACHAQGIPAFGPIWDS